MQLFAGTACHIYAYINKDVQYQKKGRHMLPVLIFSIFAKP